MDSDGLRKLLDFRLYIPIHPVKVFLLDLDAVITCAVLLEPPQSFQHLTPIHFEIPNLQADACS